MKIKIDNQIILDFPSWKKFDVDTGYVALYSTRDLICFLCRYLSVEEIHGGNLPKRAYTLVETDEDDNILEKQIIILKDDLNTLSEAEEIIGNIMRKKEK